MKKNCLKKGILFLVIAFIFVLTGKVNAATEPELKTFGGVEYFFANGTPITIVERTDGIAGANIVWNGGSQLVKSNANVFGGMHDNATSVDTSITMHGGTVRNIFGGGLHLSNTNTANIVINGGQVGGINGGGASSLTHDCGCTNATPWYSGNPTNSPCQTKTAKVTINGGKIEYIGAGYGLVFGGGEGISNTENASLTINGGDLSTAYVTAAGSNGNTTTASLTIVGGTIKVVQGVNRGTMNNLELNALHGNIERLYIGGETEDKDVTGTIFGKVNATITAKVKKMFLGTNGGKEIEIGKGNIKQEDIKVSPTSVENYNTISDKVKKLYIITVENAYIGSNNMVVANAGCAYQIDENTTIGELIEKIKEENKSEKIIKITDMELKELDEKEKIQSDLNLICFFEDEESDYNKDKDKITLEEETQQKINELLIEEVSKDENLKTAFMRTNDIKIEVNIKDVKNEEIIKEEQEEINKAVKEGKIAQYFDISLVIKVNGEVAKEISEPSRELTFTLTIPEELLKEGREFYILRVHNGKTEKLEATTVENKIEFKTDRFSTYVLAYEDKIQEEKDEVKSEEKDITPKTGVVSIALYTCIALGTVALIGTLKSKDSKH